MKEKLRALFEKIREKIAPFHSKFFPEKSEEVKTRRRVRAQGVFRTFKITIGALVLVSVGFVGGAYYYFSKHDPNEHRAWLLGKIDGVLQSRESTIEKISWGFSLKDISLGLKISGLKINDAGSIKHAEIPEFRAYISLWKLVFDAEPISISLLKPSIEFRDRESSPNGVFPPAGHSSSNVLNLPNWLASALRKNGGTQIAIKDGKVFWSQADRDAVYELNDLTAKMKFGGFPGGVRIEFDTELNIKDSAKNLTFVGPVTGKLDGSSVANANSVFLFRVAHAEIDLDRVSFNIKDMFEKSPKNFLAINFEGDIQFKDTIFFSPITAIDIPSGQIVYPPLTTEFSLKNEIGSPEYMLTWNLPKVAREDIRLPIKGLRTVAASGVLDSQGTMIIDARPNSSRGHWRLGLNNLKIDVGDLGRELEIDNASGSFLLSSVFEGELKEGEITSDRSELHMDASASAFTLARGEFSKPKGDLLNLDVSYSIQDKTMTFKEIKAKINTLDLDARGEWKNFLSTWSPDEKDAGKLSILFKSNRVNLSDWSSYLQSFRTVPLQGFVETSGEMVFNTHQDKDLFDDVEWRFDRLNLSAIRGSLDDLGLSRDRRLGGSQRRVSGPFSANIVFLGRGKGWIADRAKFVGQVDLQDGVIYFNDKFRKPVGVPAQISLSIDQMRNRANVQSARIVLNDFEVSLHGSLVRGAPHSRVKAMTRKTLDFSKWANFYLEDEASSKITKGMLEWDGSLLLPAHMSMEENFDWRDVALQGVLSLKNAEFTSPKLKSPLLISEIRANLGDQDVSIPVMNFSYSGKAGSFSGNLRPLAYKAQQLTLKELFSSDGWNARGALSLNKIDFNEIAKEQNTEMENAPNVLAIPMVIPPWWFKTAFFKGSKVDLKLSVDEILGLGAPLKKFMASIDWNGRSLRLQRFAAQAMGGIFSGSFLSDFSNYLDREESPKHSATLDLRKVSWTELERLLGKGSTPLFAGGIFGGRLTLTADGFDGIEWKKTLRARLEGDLTNSSPLFLKDFGKPLGYALMNDELKDYAMKDLFVGSCHMGNAQAKIDAQILPEEFRFDSLKLWSENSNRLDVSGVQVANGDINFSGRFDPNTSCLRGDLRTCLKNLKGTDSISVKASGPAGSAEVSVYNLPRISELRNCIEQKVSARVQDGLLKDAKARKEF